MLQLQPDQPFYFYFSTSFWDVQDTAKYSCLRNAWSGRGRFLSVSLPKGGVWTVCTVPSQYIVQVPSGCCPNQKTPGLGPLQFLGPVLRHSFTSFLYLVNRGSTLGLVSGRDRFCQILDVSSWISWYAIGTYGLTVLFTIYRPFMSRIWWIIITSERIPESTNRLHNATVSEKRPLARPAG